MSDHEKRKGSANDHQDQANDSESEKSDSKGQDRLEPTDESIDNIVRDLLDKQRSQRLPSIRSGETGQDGRGFREGRPRRTFNRDDPQDAMSRFTPFTPVGNTIMEDPLQYPRQYRRQYPPQYQPPQPPQQPQQSSSEYPHEPINNVTRDLLDRQRRNQRLSVRSREINRAFRGGHSQRASIRDDRHGARIMPFSPVGNTTMEGSLRYPPQHQPAQPPELPQQQPQSPQQQPQSPQKQPQSSREDLYEPPSRDQIVDNFIRDFLNRMRENEGFLSLSVGEAYLIRRGGRFDKNFFRDLVGLDTRNQDTPQYELQRPPQQQPLQSVSDNQGQTNNSINQESDYETEPSDYETEPSDYGTESNDGGQGVIDATRRLAATTFARVAATTFARGRFSTFGSVDNIESYPRVLRNLRPHAGQSQQLPITQPSVSSGTTSHANDVGDANGTEDTFQQQTPPQQLQLSASPHDLGGPHRSTNIDQVLENIIEDSSNRSRPQHQPQNQHRQQSASNHQGRGGPATTNFGTGRFSTFGSDDLEIMTPTSRFIDIDSRIRLGDMERSLRTQPSVLLHTTSNANDGGDTNGTEDTFQQHQTPPQQQSRHEEDHENEEQEHEEHEEESQI